MGELWISAAELLARPASGPAFQAVVSWANKPLDNPKIGDQNDQWNIQIFANALLASRGTEGYYDRTVDGLKKVVGAPTGGDGRVLAIGRNLVGVVLAADLVDYDEVPFRAWVDLIRRKTFDGMNLAQCHERRPNNWGTHAGASRIAAALYLNDQAEVEKAAAVFKGWLGDRSSYAGFKYGDLSWQCDQKNPRGVNGFGCLLQGHSVDGVLPDDQRRAGGFKWPPPKENYVYEALQGSIVQAELLYRTGRASFEWSTQALLRAYKWLHFEAKFPAGSDDTFQIPLVNYRYGTKFPHPTPTSPGKNVGFTCFTHGGLGVPPLPPPPPPPPLDPCKAEREAVLEAEAALAVAEEALAACEAG